MHLTFSIPYNRIESKWVASGYKKIVSNNANYSEGYDLLGAIANINSGLYVRGYQQTGTAYYRVDNIRKLVTNETTDDVVFISPSIALDVDDRCKARPGDILIARTGTLGKAVLALPFHKGSVLSQHLSRISIKTDLGYFPGALALYLNTPEGSEQLISLASGSTRLELTHSDLRKVRIPRLLPEVQKQFHLDLVECLESYYAAINAINKLNTDVDELLNIKDSSVCCLYFSLPTTKLDRVWSPKRFQSHILNIHDQVDTAFKTVLLSTLFNVKRGKGTRSRDYKRRGTPYIRTSSLINYSVDPFTDHYANQETYINYNQPITEDTILYSIEGKIGHCALIDQEYPVVVKNHIELLRLINIPGDIDRRAFLGWCLAVLRSKYGRVQVKQNSVTQSTIPGLASRLREFVIPVENKKRMSLMYKVGFEYYEWNKHILKSIKALQDLQETFEHSITG